MLVLINSQQYCADSGRPYEHLTKDWREITLITTSLLRNLKQTEYPDISVEAVEWQKAFLTCRTLWSTQYWVKLADATSDWTEVAGGVLQGTLSGKENFLNMIDVPHA